MRPSNYIMEISFRSVYCLFILILWYSAFLFGQDTTGLKMDIKYTDIKKAIDNVVPNREVKKVIDIIRAGLEDLEELDPSEKVERLSVIALLYKSLGDFNSSLDFFKKANKLCIQTGDDKRMIDILNEMGVIYRLQGLYMDALEKHNYALSLAMRLDYSKGLVDSKYRMGIVYRDLGKFEIGFSYLFNSLEQSELFHDTTNIALIHNSIGNAYRTLNENETALYYYNLSLQSFKEMKDSSRMSILMNNMGRAEQNLLHYERALTLFSDGLQIDVTHLNIQRIAKKFNNLGSVYVQMGNFREADEYLNKSLVLYRFMNSVFGIANVQYNLGKLYLAQNDPDNALSCLLPSFRASKEIKMGSLAYKSSMEISRAYYLKTNFPEAYRYKHIAHQYSDSLYNIRNALKIAMIENEYRLQKELQISRLKKEKRNIIFFFTSTVIAILLAFALITLIRQKRKIAINKSIQGTMKKEKQYLETLIKNKNIKLNAHALQLFSKNELLKKASGRIAEIKKNSVGTQKLLLQNIINELEYGFDENVFEEFEMIYKDIDRGFFNRLIRKLPTLTPNEIRLCALLRLNLNTKEISYITKQSLQSILMARSRLRKKIGLANGINLNAYFSGF